MNEEDITKIFEKLIKIRNVLKNKKDNEINPIYLKLDPVKPYLGKLDIKIVIIGQDPTVKKHKSREKIKFTLNLDKKGVLKNYVEKIISVDNVYATNLFKYFYTCPPADTIEILNYHLNENIQLLQQELNYFPNLPIITFGEPVLKLISKKPEKDMKYYWNYKNNSSGYKFCEKEDSKINRIFFPFPHQPTIARNGFYKDNLENFIKFFFDNLKNIL